MIDESTDITTTKHLDIYVSYITKEGISKTRFLCLVPLTNSNAEGITKVLVSIFKTKKILFKLVAFVLDGASVMLGKNESVAARLSRICTYPLIINHCVAHRLALACKDAKKEIKFYEEVEFLVKKIYNYFKNSCSRIQQLQEIQNLLDDPVLKIKRLYEIRWLAWYEAIKNIYPMIQATINSIQKEYILIDQNQRFGRKVQAFIDETYPFRNSVITYMDNDVSFVEQDYDDFIMDIYDYATSFGNNELENLLKHFEHLNFYDNVQLPALFDINKCREEWPGFKMIITNSFSSNDIETILPLLIQDYNDVFSNLIKLIQIVYCIFFSSIECERGFSKQNKIKTKDRNSLATNTLDMLMRISLEEPESLKFNYDRA
ncbi:20591_t:CDS:2 [Funneliformis geosporum]|uniref:6355_t:CDS:1 n=1 Tax=Funneliformis geosporum TaxID=1117311 RepID=A0A9W4SXL2_9GLOM|nr:6355_t:CDS:2 [Funneliformis geosporum]CAI2185337.1 20591_t:CDS:2 [Funneliformis geosporum]